MVAGTLYSLPEEDFEEILAIVLELFQYRQNAPSNFLSRS